MLTKRSMCLALLILAVGACRQADNDATGDRIGQGEADTSMANMPGMRGAGGSEHTMAAMETHLEGIERSTGAELKTGLVLHRPTVANMIAQLDREMHDMNMTADAAWNAALDTLRQDLRVMPELSPEALRDMMPEHSARVRRVIAMHRSMMAKMGH